MKFLTVVIVVYSTLFASITLGSITSKKRGIHDVDFNLASHAFPGFELPGLGFGYGAFSPPPHGHVLIHKVDYPVPSSADIAAAVTAAKEASASVMAAQHRVQIAKEEVLAHQRIANHKEAQATLALQRAEAQAAVQRQQASAASNAVVAAQQRLAHAKAEVAAQQRFAASKESHAAAAIQRSAAAAAIEIQRTENAAAKIASIQRSEAAALKHAAAAKDASLTATTAAVAASSGQGGPEHGGWVDAGKLIDFGPWG